jgi:hypothetical protein
MSKGAYSNIYPHGPKAGVLYGLPKIHQAGVPVRPIISVIEFKGILPNCFSKSAITLIVLLKLP